MKRLIVGVLVLVAMLLAGPSGIAQAGALNEGIATFGQHELASTVQYNFDGWPMDIEPTNEIDNNVRRLIPAEPRTELREGEFITPTFERCRNPGERLRRQVSQFSGIGGISVDDCTGLAALCSAVAATLSAVSMKRQTDMMLEEQYIARSLAETASTPSESDLAEAILAFADTVERQTLTTDLLHRLSQHPGLDAQTTTAGLRAPKSTHGLPPCNHLGAGRGGA